MDETDTTFDERVNEIRERRRGDFGGGGVTGLSVFEDPGMPQVGGGTDLGHPDFRTTDTDDDEVEQLRRDVSRLEGKVDALLTALDVED
jgi:hypothetical protein